MKWSDYYKLYPLIILVIIAIIFTLLYAPKSYAHVDLIDPGAGVHLEIEELREKQRNEHIPPPMDRKDAEKAGIIPEDDDSYPGELVWLS